jgi:hypothetical protein
MILTDKPRRKPDDAKQLELPATSRPNEAQENWGVVCYFLDDQNGPVGFENTTLLTISLEYLHSGYMEELNQYVLPKGKFFFDKTNNRFFLRPEAIKIAKQLAREYHYSIKG